MRWAQGGIAWQAGQAGQTVSTNGILPDMTELKRAEGERERAFDGRFQAVFEQAAIGIALLSLQGRYILANERYCSIVGYSQEELAERTFQEATHPSDLEANLECLRRMLAGDVQSFSLEKRYLRRDGSITWVQLTGSLVRSDSGTPMHFIAIVEDIDKRKQVEAQLAQQAVELKRRAEDLARSNAELEQFAYVASHDLREPLRMVASYTQLLARRYQGKLDADADEFIHYAVDGATRMQRLIDDLLAYSRVGTRNQACEPTDCEAVLAQALVNLSMAIEETGAIITHDPLPTLQADGTQLVQLFQNLIGNAIKFHGSRRPCVHVSARRCDREWIFSVRDNGIGIDPQYSERIFVIFQRLHRRDEYPGNGIGLAICKKIVQCHDGRIWLESTPGQGATFFFALPQQTACGGSARLPTCTTES